MRLGVDFGTCNSSSAFVDGEEVIPMKDPTTTTLSYLVPSSIYVSPTGKILIGKHANNQRRRDFSLYRHELKRYLGETTPMWFGKLSFTPIEMIAEIVGKIKRDADAYARDTGRATLKGAVITIPATYQDYKRGLMRQVAVKAGFTVEDVELLEEPVAAGLYYARQKKMQEDEILLVYDLGGGTFDTALLERHEGTFTFYKDTLPRGIDPCGGVDFDRMIYLDFVKRHPEVQELLKPERTDELALIAQAIVGEACTELKHLLSDDDEAEIPLPVPGVPGIIYHQLTRPVFNEMIAGTIRETLECCRTMIQSAHLQYARINRVLLVGGSCRIPYVREQLKQEFRCTVDMADDLELVVCKGAAIYATRNEKPQVVQPPPPPPPPLPPTHEQPPSGQQGTLRRNGGKVGDLWQPENPWDVLRKKEK
jgi:molecular chaperone DnaK (HSP70)